MPSNTSVQVTPGVGPAIRLRSVTVDSVAVDQEVVGIAGADGTLAAVQADGAVIVTESGATLEGLVTRHTMVATGHDVQVVLANSLRCGFTVFNEGSNVMYIGCGSSVSTTHYHFAIGPAVSGVPSGIDVTDWRGEVHVTGTAGDTFNFAERIYTGGAASTAGSGEA